MKTLVIANQKGGVGKSALVSQFALYAGSLGLKVLVADLDHQANTTNALKGHATVQSVEYLSSVLLSARDTRLVAPNVPIGLVGADDALGALERQAESHNQFAGSFRQAIETATGFDLCLIDTNPNPDNRVHRALAIGERQVVPDPQAAQLRDQFAGFAQGLIYGVFRLDELLASSDDDVRTLHTYLQLICRRTG